MTRRETPVGGDAADGDLAEHARRTGVVWRVPHGVVEHGDERLGCLLRLGRVLGHVVDGECDEIRDWGAAVWSKSSSSSSGAAVRCAQEGTGTSRARALLPRVGSRGRTWCGVVRAARSAALPARGRPPAGEAAPHLVDLKSCIRLKSNRTVLSSTRKQKRAASGMEQGRTCRSMDRHAP